MKQSFTDFVKSIPNEHYTRVERLAIWWESFNRIATPCRKCGKKIPLPSCKDDERDPVKVTELCNQGYCYGCAWAIYRQP